MVGDGAGAPPDVREARRKRDVVVVNLAFGEHVAVSHGSPVDHVLIKVPRIAVRCVLQRTTSAVIGVARDAGPRDVTADWSLA